MRRKSERGGRWGANAATATLALLATVTALSCNTNQQADAQALLDKVITAHGGMQAWQSLHDLTFTLTLIALSPQGEEAAASKSLYYLKQQGKARVESITGKGVKVEGFDGEKPWVTVNGKPEAGEEALRLAQFQSVNWWYWIGVPFKLKDPGVILTYKGTAAFRGQPVEILEVTFQPGVGSTNDRFVYSIDPKTGRIVFVEFQLQPGVWPGVGGQERSEWLDYKQVGPFTMHTRRVYYGDAKLNHRTRVILFGDFQVNSGLDDSLFRPP
jgi:uncharacterized protein DUF6503